MPRELAKAQEIAEVTNAETLLARLRGLQRVTLGILAEAQADGDHRVALVAIHEARSSVELLARLWFWPGHSRTGEEPRWNVETGITNGGGRIRQVVREMPPGLRKMLAGWLLQRRRERVARQRAEVEEKIRGLYPEPIRRQSDSDD